VLVLNNDEYRLVTGIATHMTTHLNDPLIMPTTLANNTALTHHAQIMADCNLKCQEYWKQEAADSVNVGKIVCKGIDTTYIKALYDDFVGYSAQTTKLIIVHFCHEWCIITTLKQKQAAAAFHIQWDLMSHITKFARKLNKQHKLCRDIRVAAADAPKIKYYVESMYTSDKFHNKEIQAWEVKPTADKTWEATKSHFVMLYKAKKNSTWNISLALESMKVPTT
jgi:hypothetical protein